MVGRLPLSCGRSTGQRLQLSDPFPVFAKDVDLAALLGWDTLVWAYASVVEHRTETGVICHDMGPEELTRNASDAAGLNTLPLFHF